MSTPPRTVARRTARHRVAAGAALAALTAGALTTLGTVPAAAAPAPAPSALGYDVTGDTGGLQAITRMTGAQAAWKAGTTGRGIDVALIDSGVAPVQGLTSGNVVNGPDLSFDSQNPHQPDHVDAFGHGTHMASLIVGRDAVQARPAGYVGAAPTQVVGMAPDARLINLKVASADGGADVTQVIAAVNWVVEHADDPGFNIRVLSLSYGTNADVSRQSWQTDPLSYAVEQAWRKGIVVVVAGGNDGRTTTTSLANPAMDPRVLAVGASDPRGTLGSSDDVVPGFATHGTNQRHVDVVAPGVHVLGLKVPNSLVDVENPSAAVGSRFLRGSGTSQATAVVAGAAALLLQAHPEWTPDLVKAALVAGARPFSGASAQYRGSGLIDVTRAMAGPGSTGAQSAPAATGTGSLELARGDVHAVDPEDGAVLSGEQDVFGHPWDAASWAQRTAAGTTWQGGQWMGHGWSGDGWGGSSWTAQTWQGRAWLDNSWTGRAWLGRAWLGRAWLDNGWSGRAWLSDSGWTGRAWLGRAWLDAGWSSAGWE